jgi:beta-lactamase family protein
MTRLGLLLSSVTAPPPALAASCFAAVAGSAPMVMPASLRLAAAGEAALAFLGHASFLIESPGGVRIVTDDNGVDRPGLIPDLVTMNHAHRSHCTELVDPRRQIRAAGLGQRQRHRSSRPQILRCPHLQRADQHPRRRWHEC